jgi:hypothetical protein
MNSEAPTKTTKKGGCCSGKKTPAESSEVEALVPLLTLEITPIVKGEEEKGGCQCCSSNIVNSEPVDGIISYLLLLLTS